jgi:lipid-binding SYLF domain-containing protein
MELKTSKIKVAGISMMAILSVILLAAAVLPAGATDADDAQAIVDKARITFSSFARDEHYGYLNDNLKNVKGLLIFPQVLKAGFILGGSGGTGVLVARDPKTGNWSEPAFYTIGAVSFGLQIGGEAAEVIMMIMSQRAVDSLLTTSVKLGGDTSIALGPVGAGAKGAVTADIISFAKSKGIYAGLNLEGSVVKVRNGLNNAYYGRETRPAEIIVKNEVSNKGSTRLRETLQKAAR